MNAARTCGIGEGKAGGVEREPIWQTSVGEFLQYQVRVGLQRRVLLGRRVEDEVGAVALHRAEPNRPVLEELPADVVEVGGPLVLRIGGRGVVIGVAFELDTLTVYPLLHDERPRPDG